LKLISPVNSGSDANSSVDLCFTVTQLPEPNCPDNDPSTLNVPLKWASPVIAGDLV